MNLEESKYNIYIKIIDKIRYNDFNFDDNINEFMNLVNDMNVFIYKNKFNVNELNCCQQIKEIIIILYGK
jgi:hypothetical protein